MKNTDFEQQEAELKRTNLNGMRSGDSRLPLETEGCCRKDKAVAAAQFKTYVCRYYHNSSWWGLDIKAADLADAEARVAKLGNLQLQGELKMTIPVRSGAWLPMTICTIRNTVGAWWNTLKG